MKIIVVPNWNVLGVTTNGYLVSEKDGEYSVVPEAKIVEPDNGMTFFFDNGNLTIGRSTEKRRGIEALDELRRLKNGMRLLKDWSEVKETEINLMTNRPVLTSSKA